MTEDRDHGNTGHGGAGHRKTGYDGPRPDISHQIEANGSRAHRPAASPLRLTSANSARPPHCEIPDRD